MSNEVEIVTVLCEMRDEKQRLVLWVQVNGAVPFQATVHDGITLVPLNAAAHELSDGHESIKELILEAL